MTPLSSLVIVTWDGKSTPFSCVHFDCSPQFKILLFDYSGKVNAAPLNIPHVDYFISASTENKGQVFESAYRFLKNEKLHFEYVGFIDDDILFSISSFNEMIHVARQHQLHVFQPSIAKDSFYSHRKFIHQTGYYVTKADWVEIMAPFYEQSLFEACQPYFQYAISGQGIDCYIMPCIQQLAGKTNTGVVHTTMIKHTRPIRTHLRTYSNGLTGVQEMAILKEKAIQIIDNQQVNDKFDSNFRKKYFLLSDPNNRSFENKLRQSYTILKNVVKRLKEMAHFD